MTLIITHDSLTPFVKRLPKRIRNEAPKVATKIVKRGAKIARGLVSGQRSKDLQANIVAIPARPGKPAVLLSGSKSSLTGFPYPFWVNRDVSITGRKPYFNNGKKVMYGDKRFKAIWRMTPAYFNITIQRMNKMMPKGMRRFWRRISK